MRIDDFHSFNLADTVKFHKELNPAIFNQDKKMDSDVRRQLLMIAKDFVEDLGISDFEVSDVTISGSNAAYSYTKNSDLDLHILVDFNSLPDSDVYQELFNAKKSLYNDEYDITVRGIPVELYVQDTNQPHVTLGEYSVLNDKWLKIPTKHRANFNHTETKLKFEKLYHLLSLAYKAKDYDKLLKVLDTLKRYRRAGLDAHGEFGPENLAYKALRNLGLVQDLFDLKSALHSKKLSIESAMDEDYDPNGPPPGPEFPPTMPQGTIRVDVSDVYDWYKLGQHISNLKGLGKHDFGKGPPSTILSFGDEDLEHKYIDALKKTGLDTTDIDPKAHDTKKGQKVDPTYNVNEEEVDEATRRDFLKSLGAVGAATAAGGAEAGKFVNVADRIIKPTRDWDKEKQILLTRCDNILTRLVGLINQQRAKQGQKPIRKPYLDVGVEFALASAEGDYKDGVIRMDVTVFYDLKDDTIAAVIGHELGHLMYGDALSGYIKTNPQSNIETELRADVFGVQLMMAAGYDPKRALQQLIDQGTDYGNQKSDTHPTLKQRQKNINDSLKREIFHLTSALRNYNQNYQYLASLQQKQNKGFAESASGYIPSKKEAKDPRFSSALTIDIKPDSIQKNAKAFGSKISRAGIPPIARSNGKI